MKYGFGFNYEKIQFRLRFDIKRSFSRIPGGPILTTLLNGFFDLKNIQNSTKINSIDDNIFNQNWHSQTLSPLH